MSPLGPLASPATALQAPTGTPQAVRSALGCPQLSLGPVRHSLPNQRMADLSHPCPPNPAAETNTQCPSQLPAEIPPPRPATRRAPSAGGTDLGALPPPPHTPLGAGAQLAVPGPRPTIGDRLFGSVSSPPRALCQSVGPGFPRAGVSDAPGASSALGSSTLAAFFWLTLDFVHFWVAFPLSLRPHVVGRNRGSLTRECCSCEDPAGGFPTLPP